MTSWVSIVSTGLPSWFRARGTWFCGRLVSRRLVVVYLVSKVMGYRIHSFSLPLTESVSQSLTHSLLWLWISLSVSVSVTVSTTTRIMKWLMSVTLSVCVWLSLCSVSVCAEGWIYSLYWLYLLYCFNPVYCTFFTFWIFAEGVIRNTVMLCCTYPNRE